MGVRSQYAPLKTDFVRAVAVDETIKTTLAEDMTIVNDETIIEDEDVIETEKGVKVDEKTGEIIG